MGDVALIAGDTGAADVADVDMDGAVAKIALLAADIAAVDVALVAVAVAVAPRW